MKRLNKTFKWVGGKIDYLVEDVPLGWHITVFLVVVVLFGMIYMFLTPSGNGIGQAVEPLDSVSIYMGIYFSITTITSLGYSDLHPIGLARLLVCLEALFGVSSIGIMIARLASQRMTYHVSRLFSSEIQSRIERFQKGLQPGA